MATVGSTAYVVDDVSGLWLIDVSFECSTPRAPGQTLRSVDFGNPVYGVLAAIVPETDINHVVSLWLAGCPLPHHSSGGEKCDPMRSR